MNARYRPLKLAAAAIAAVWLLALGGYVLAGYFKMTPEKLRAYLESTDLSKLSGADRAKALHRLADKINALAPEDRRHARIDRMWEPWFAEMTEAEKAEFLDETLPSGFHQMLTAFEQQPADKRQRAITDAVKKLREQRESPTDNSTNAVATGSNAPPVLSPELQQRVTTIGLNSVYSSSSAQTKAELAPLLEEIQKNMETGRLLRGGH